MSCFHPRCDRPAYRAGYLCTMHFAQLPNDLKRRAKQSGRITAEQLEDLHQDIVELFDARMIGEHESVPCRGDDCDALIVWMKGFRRDGSSYSVPVNADSVEEHDIDFDRKKHSPHWETCPNANDFRKARGGDR